MAENNKSNQNNKAEAVIIAQEPGTRNQEPGTRNKIAICEYGKVDQYAKYIKGMSPIMQNNSGSIHLTAALNNHYYFVGYDYLRYKNGSYTSSNGCFPVKNYFLPLLVIN